MSLQPEDMHRELAEIFEAFPQIHTSDIPGIDLYMDQVTTFLQENLRGLSRDPDGDKFLTKTMINNYVKNKVLMPPVKKKYSREHMMLLIMIYYMKSFLSIGDIRTITTPIMARYAADPADTTDRKKDAAERRKDSAERKREAAERKKEAAERKKEAAERKKDNPDLKKVSPDCRREADDNKTAKDFSIPDIYEAIVREIDSELSRIRGDIERDIDLSAEVFTDIPEEDGRILQRFSLICRLSAEVYMRKLFIEKLLDTDSSLI